MCEYIGEIVFLIVSFVFIFFFNDVKTPFEQFIGGRMPIFGPTESRANCNLNPPCSQPRQEIQSEQQDYITDESYAQHNNLENFATDSATKCFSCEAQAGYKGNNTKCFSCEAQMGEAGQQKKCFSCGSTLLDNTDSAFMASCPNCDKKDNANLNDVGNYFLLD